MRLVLATLALALIAPLAVPSVVAQDAGLAAIFDGVALPAPAENVVVPQARALRLGSGTQGIALASVDVMAEVTARTAATVMVVTLRNNSDRAQEAELLVPVPRGAVVRGFDFEGGGARPSARLLPADEARFTYQAIVNEVRDPALLEFAGHELVRSSVFPVPAHGIQRVRLLYESVLELVGERFEYVLPRSESMAATQTPWTISLIVKAEGPLATIYSPTHDADIQRVGTSGAAIRLTKDVAREPGPFRCAFVLASGSISGTFWGHPDARLGGGTFLLLAGLPEVNEERFESVRREVVVVLDRSGSMAGSKLDQAVRAARQVIGGLRENESFNIIDYSDDVACFRAAPVPRTTENLFAAEDYLERLRSDGETAIDKALVAALSQEHTEGALPLVLFLTDGIPTAGVRSEVEIRENALAANVHQRRVFTFGVGSDVNAPLLDGLARVSGGESTYVQPGGDVEQVVSQVAKRLRGPIFTGGVLRVLGADGQPRPDLVSHLLPSVAGDFYSGDQIVLLGAYRGTEPFVLELSGAFLGEPARYTYTFDPVRDARGANAFVARLWASRRIGELTDQLRQAGADPSVANNDEALQQDPVLREYVDTIVDLSIEYGILSEFTSFLALEGTDLSHAENVFAGVSGTLLRDLIRIRVGNAAVGRSEVVRAQMYRKTLDRLNRGSKGGGKSQGKAASAAGALVQQIGDRAFFLRSGVWIDSHLVRRPGGFSVDERVVFGSPRHREIVARLVREGRGGLLSLRGEFVLELDGRAVRMPTGTPLELLNSVK